MRHTKKEVLERTSKEFAQLDRLVRRLAPADWQRKVPRPEGKDPWTVKDSLAHIVHWKEYSARVSRGEKRPPELRGLEVNEINAIVYRRWHRRRSADVIAWHQEVQADVIRTLQSLPESFFTRREHASGWPGDFTSHSAWHRQRDIEAARRPGRMRIARREKKLD